MRIPSDNNWTQTNKGDISGVLHETENITLDTDGKLRLSRKAFNRLNNTDYPNLKDTLGIVYYNGQYIALTKDNAFKFDFGGSTTTEIVLTSGVDFSSDIMVAYSRAYITRDTKLDYYDGSVTAGVYTLTTGVPHPMALFDSLTTSKLCVGNGNTVVPLSSSHVAGTSLILPPQYQVTTLAYRNGYLYVGTKDTSGGEARVFVWDGNSTLANYDIPVGASQVYSIIPYQATVALMTNKGQLLAVSGNSTVELASLPVYNNVNAVWDNAPYLSYPSKVLHRGMVAVADKIYIHIDGTVDSGFMSEMKHGLWVFNPSRGLYHHSYSGVDRSVAETPSNLTDSTLTISTHNLKDGDLALMRVIGSLTGLSLAHRYYVKVISDTEIKLALSRKALKAGNYVTIGGAVTGSNISYVPNTEYSQYNNSFAGGITAINPEESFWTGWETPVIWGNRMEDLAGDEFYGIYSFTTAYNVGRFTTQRIYTDNITQNWQKLFGFFCGLTLDNEKIIVKYKTDCSSSYPTDVFNGVWLNENTINSSTDITDQWTDIEVGDELTIVDGYGRGYTTHVTAITNSASVYSITVDESIGTANGDVYFSADKFVKVTEITNSTQKINKGLFEARLENVSSPFIILKVELRGFEIEVDMLELMNAVNSKGN